MADQEQLDILKQGVKVWNEWRKEHPDILPDLRGANLRAATLDRANLSYANLKGANLRAATLNNVYLKNAKLKNANLDYANLDYANLGRSDLDYADLDYASLKNTKLGYTTLRFANLRYADIRRANLYNTDFTNADLGYTVFGNVNLSTAKGLEMVKHIGPSTIGIDTIIRSQGNIPETFLRGAGVDDTFITYIRSLVGKPIEYYSCFISYSSKDDAFAKQLYADLQNNNVRCWFAPENMKIGDRIRSRIDESIRTYDRLLLILSEHSVSSKWVEFEVEAAMDKELEGKPTVLFPVRLDNTVMESTTAWAAHIKRTRHIGDFTNWKNHDDYEKAFTRLLRDLKAEA